MRKITHIVLHCTATPYTAKVSSIQAYWRDVLKWKSPGYHYVIEADGKVHMLQPENLPSNGVAGHNAHSIHISYIGGVENGKAKDTRTCRQIESMIMLLKVMKQKYPQADIVGHRDFSPDKNGNGKIDGWEYIKECPSFDVKTWLKTIEL